MSKNKQRQIRKGQEHPQLDSELRIKGQQISAAIGNGVAEQFPLYHTHTKSGFIEDEDKANWVVQAQLTCDSTDIDAVALASYLKTMVEPSIAKIVGNDGYAMAAFIDPDEPKAMNVEVHLWRGRSEPPTQAAKAVLDVCLDNRKLK
jgi:hypothetical protein